MRPLLSLLAVFAAVAASAAEPVWLTDLDAAIDRMTINPIQPVAITRQTSNPVHGHDLV